MRTRPALAALVADVVCVVVFCTIGRRSHAEGLTVAGIAETAWPFLAGTAVGWLLARGWRRPVAVVPTGVVVWVCTVVVGMLLRKATSAGRRAAASWWWPRWRPPCCCSAGAPWPRSDAPLTQR